MQRRVVLIPLMFTSGAFGQWLNYPHPGTPRTRDGKPNLSARAPRAANGKPDLSGVWHVEPTSRAEMRRLFGDDIDKIEVPGMEIDTISKYAINLLLDYKTEEVQAILRPEAAALLKNAKGFIGGCQPLGIPLTFLVSEPEEIVQAPNQIVILHESDGSRRQIHLDARPLPKDPSSTWLGYSVGKWEGDTLVVETAGFNDRTMLDARGLPHGESLRVTERYDRRDFGHLDVEVAFEDPQYYTKPFRIKITQRLLPDSDILETVCTENEKDLNHIGTK